MIYLERRPAPPLSNFVELVWYCADYRARHRREIVFPSGSPAIVIALAHERMPNWDRDLSKPEPVSEDCAALVAGVHTGYMVIDTAALDSLVGVQFRPTGAFPFFGGTPLMLFRDSHVPLSDFWSRSAVEELRERAAQAPTPSQKLDVVEAALLERLVSRDANAPTPSTVTYAANCLVRAPHIETVAGVAAQTGLSARRLSDLFNRCIGISPKAFCRVRRFRLAVDRMSQGREVRWAELAADCGYYDQSHFIHDFREFSGINPNAYASRRSAWHGHLIA